MFHACSLFIDFIRAAVPPLNKTRGGSRKFPAGAALALPVLGLMLAACTSPRLQPSPKAFTTTHLAANHIRFPDGYRLPLRRWVPAGEPRYVVLALHGFNDYSYAFRPLGRYLAARGGAVYAYDQRGFGASPYRGLWPGTNRLRADAAAAVEALRRRYPDKPLYLLGESMGGAVAMLAAADGDLAVDGLLLLAPAVWGRASMSVFTRAALWLTVRTVPDRRWSGEALDIKPTDNLQALRRMSRDPLVIKRSRTDALWGMTNLMDRAAAVTPALEGRLLLLYGLNDEVIPKASTCAVLRRLARRPGTAVLLYPEGYHLLLQDTQAANVLADIHAWMQDEIDAAPAPYRLAGDAWKSVLCED